MSAMLNKLKNKLIEVAKELAPPLASEEVSLDRLNICENCEHLIKISRQCGKCFCFVDGKTKLENADCPIGKW